MASATTRLACAGNVRFHPALTRIDVDDGYWRRLLHQPMQTIRLDPAVNKTFHFWYVFVAGLQAGAHYASHVYNPIGLAGNATTAYELWEQLGRAPQTVVLPVGHGTLLLGLHRGFKALRAAG
jgi:hypothetical protein